MRFSSISLLALGGLLTSAVAGPIIDARQEATGLADLTNLLTTVETYTGAINTTVATITAASTSDEVTAAIASVGSELTSILDAVDSAASSISTLTPGTKRSLAARQDEIATLANALSALLNEIFATVSGAVATLGLSGLLGFLNPLTGGLGGLILAVEVLVDLLLVDVTVLLNSLLTGLALGLGGLTL